MYKVKRIRIERTSEDEFLYRLQYGHQHRLEGVAVHYRAKIEGQWRSVCRYDNAHGPPHVHKFWDGGKISHVSQEMPPLDFLKHATEDLYENWRKFRAWLENSYVAR